MKAPALLLVVVSIFPTPWVLAAAVEVVPLASARQVRALSAEEVAGQPPVRMRGVITFHEPETGITFVQDDTAGVAISAGTPSRLPAELQVGSRVEVEGAVARGSFAPVVSGRDGAPPAVAVLGFAAMPAPLNGSIEVLLGGVNDGRWVELGGTVRLVEARPFAQETEEPRENGAVGKARAPTLRLRIELGTIAGRFTLIIPWNEGRTLPGELLDSRVRERSAEVAYLTELLGRLKLQAPADGMALFADAEDWRGKPVQVGERIMTVADPAQVNLTIFVSPDDAIALDPGADVKMYLNITPLAAYDAQVVQASYEAGASAEGHPAYIVKAAFAAGETLPRLGLNGTAKIYAERVPFVYYLLRKPLRTLRHAIGV